MRKLILSKRGFTLFECVVAASIMVIALLAVMSLCVTATKNAKFAERAIDSNVLISQKSNDLFNSLSRELSKFPKGQVQVGSINADQPIAGYYDTLNQYGCIIGTTNGTNGILSTVDCSHAVTNSPVQDVTPKFRRQWTIKKNYPRTGDVTIAVTLVYIDLNQITKTLLKTKSDGLSTN